MKIAICLSGLVRTYRETYQNFIDCLIEPNKHHNIDVFISTWPTEHSNNTMERTRRIAWYGDQSKPFPEELIDHRDLHSKYQPTTFEIEKPKSFDVSWYEKPPLNLQSLNLMLYKILACDLLRLRHEKLINVKYDCVIRARFDVLYPHPLKIDEMDLENIIIPSMMQPPVNEYNWANDKLAIGNNDNITYYSRWFFHLREMVQNENIPLQPETLLYYYLSKKDIKVSPLGYELDLVRIEGY